MEKLLTVRELAQALKLPPGSVYRIIRRGCIQKVSIGRLIRISERDFEKFILGNRGTRNGRKKLGSEGMQKAGKK